MKRLVVLPLIFICTLVYPQDDKLLKIIQAELNREVSEFTKVAQPPYFIDYRVNDVESASIVSSFGSLTQSYVSHDRSMSSDVRVGDYLVDNTHPNENGIDDYFYGSSPLSLDDNEDAIRYELWRATQSRYRSALEKLNAVKSELAMKKEEKSPPDFSKEKTTATYYEEPGVKLKDIFHKETWEEKARRYSKLFLADASIVSADVSIAVSCERRYYVSSEGASVVQNFISAYINIFASVRATDGEIVPLHQNYYAPMPNQLPGDQIIENDIRTMITTLQKLKVAPLADPYTGPALLDGPVAGVFFHEIFGHRIEGHRLRSDMDGQTFKSKVNEKILPESISVYCDPTVKQFAGTYLNGIYSYDDEGVKAERVNVVEKGTLRNFLMSRTPLENFSNSNGHGRATDGLTPVSRQSNLFVNADKTRSSNELRQMLIKECKRQKKAYGYLFKSVVGGFTTTDRYQPNAFNIFPTEVYRIYVDGRADELVRGVDLIGTPLAMFAEIGGVGDTHGVFTGFCGAESGYVPVSAISPSLFVRRIETQKKVKTKVEVPLLPAPTSVMKEGVNAVQQAMRDELDRNMKELQAAAFDKPFFINYAIAEETSVNISAELGSLVSSQETKFRFLQSARVLVGDYDFNDESFDDNMLSLPMSNEISLPLDDDYPGIRRSLWTATDNTYRGASQHFSKNKELLKEQNKPLAEIPHRRFAKVTPSKINLTLPEFKFDKTATEEYMRKLSEAFAEFKDLRVSDASFSYKKGYRYQLNSEGSENRIPYTAINIYIGASLRTAGGEEIYGNKIFTYPTTDLPPLETLTKEVKVLAESLMSTTSISKFDEEYIGPVLFVGPEVVNILRSRLVNPDQGLIANNFIPFLKGYNYERQSGLENKIGKSIFAEGMTVKAFPKLKSYNNISLLGAFEVDSEGVVPAEETVLVDNGVLRNMMHDRTPVKESQVPNGLGDGPGVLSVTFKSSTPLSELKAKLIERAKQEGLDYAIMVKGTHNRESFGRSMIVYKVYVDDGREEIVRNASMHNINQRDFRKIAATSKEMIVENHTDGTGGYLSIICPEAMLFEEVEFSPSELPTFKEESYVSSPLKK